jgi:hypothetical protein
MDTEPIVDPLTGDEVTLVPVRMGAFWQPAIVRNVPEAVVKECADLVTKKDLEELAKLMESEPGKLPIFDWPLNRF